MTKTKQVFISHATEDAQFAHRLAHDLQRLGVQVWIAPDSIRPGESWVSAIERGLKDSSHAVVVLTPAALESEWVKKETDVTIAQERKGRIQVIPLGVKPCEVPILLGSYQMVSFRRDYDASLSQLADILGVRVTVSAAVRSTIEEQPAPGPPADETAVDRVTERSYLAKLREILTTRFNEEELRTLCFDFELGIDYDDLPARGKANKARELVDFMERRGRILDLVEIVKQLRPGFLE